MPLHPLCIRPLWTGTGYPHGIRASCHMHHAHIVLCDRDNFLRAALIEIPDDGDLIRGIDGTVDMIKQAIEVKEAGIRKIFSI